MAQKKTIYYSRTYRRIHTNFAYALLYIFILVLPTLIIFILILKPITLFLSNLTIKVLQGALPGREFLLAEGVFFPFGPTYYVDLQSKLPSSNEVLINLLVITVVVAFLVMSSFRGRPLAVYLLFSSMIHIISCVYFIFSQDYFVYTATIFSDIFMKQQISIWILFIVMMGIITAFVGGRDFISRWEHSLWCWLTPWFLELSAI